MKYWKFKDYCSPAGNDKISEWYRGLSAPAQADLDVTLDLLAGTEDWVASSAAAYAPLHGKQRGMGEIKFRTNNVQYRVIGYFDRNRVFVLLMGASHKQRVYKPPDALNQAVKRRELIRREEAGLRDHE